MSLFAFQTDGSGAPGTGRTAPDSGQPPGSPGSALPEREWGLTAGQVVLVVVAIVAACEVIGAFG